MAVCDNCKCDLVARMEIPQEEDIPCDAVKLQFIEGLRASGWSITIEAQLCPKHANGEAKKLVQVARAIPGILQHN